MPLETHKHLRPNLITKNFAVYVGQNAIEKTVKLRLVDREGAKGDFYYDIDLDMPIEDTLTLIENLVEAIKNVRDGITFKLP